jgi:nitroreductase
VTRARRSVGAVPTWDAIRARRNVRAYTDQPLDPADVERILEAGWRAPSAKNRQAWDFVLVTDRGQLAELATVWQGARFIPGSRAAIVLTVPDPQEERYRVIDRFDLGQATMAMMLAATDLGIGSGHASVHDQDALRRIIGMPEGHTGVALIGLGYPADRPLGAPVKLDRRPFDEVVHRGTW